MKKIFLVLSILLFGIGFVYSQTITVTSPRSGDIWYKGNSSGYTIRWTKSGTMNENVKIRLYRGNEKILGIVDSTPNDGEYTWHIPDSVSAGRYKIRVKTIDNTVFDDGEEFDIREGIPPSEEILNLTIISPHRGDIWYKRSGRRYVIRWTKNGAMNANVKIGLYQGLTRVFSIVSSTPNDGEYEWHIPDSVATGRYKIRIKTIDNTIYADGENFEIKDGILSSETPTIAVINPHLRDIWEKGYSYNITWTKTGSMDKQVKIILYRTDRSRIHTLIVRTTNNDGLYNWKIPNSIPSGQYLIKVKTIDDKVYDYSEPFEIKKPLNLKNVFGGEIRAAHDLEIKDIYYATNSFNRGGLFVKIKNYGNSFSGKLKFEIFAHQIKQEHVKYLYMRRDEEKRIYLIDKSLLGETTTCGLNIRVRIDPDNEIKETNENNNSLTKTIYIKKADLIVRIPRREFKVLKTTGISSYRWEIQFKVHAKAEGMGYSFIPRVWVKWQLYNERTGEPVNMASGSFGPSSFANGEDGVIFFHQRFGYPGKRSSIKPRLREGLYSIRVTIKSDVEICDINERNNSANFTFTLR